MNNSTEKTNLPLDAADQQLLNEFRELWKKADVIWDKHQDNPAFESYVSADYEEVFQALLDLRGEGIRFVEWGSGLGVVTIMADRMGFEAWGIEAKDLLIGFAEQLAEELGSEADFAHGSFIPNDFEWNPAAGDEAVRTMIDLPDGYDELGMELRDFDLIYSYPWPTEHDLYHNVMREFANVDAILLTYDAREGIGIVRNSEL